MNSVNLCEIYAELTVYNRAGGFCDSLRTKRATPLMKSTKRLKIGGFYVYV
jgi:hypothetical protein